DLVIASHNPGKVREIAALLKPYGANVKSAAELGLPEPEETGDTFTANAELKARAAATGAGTVALADDSGLVVPALNGAPGIRSARWAGPDRDFGMAMTKVHEALQASGTRAASDPRAYFVCALTLSWPDGHVESVEGRVDGTLVWPPRGDRGFGYDAMFLPDGYDKTFGEMDPDEKHGISHRADAFRKLIDAYFEV
ncbi:MAG: RdgB/HAM1 family non-canonical purine NTP pyrophosphatase, partial [Rhodospirillales bacterium]|nr:RdgB/HAM1 family non-canonical purine NTP pyrophosphatase [Rhodospirillales bacterium]